MIPSALHWVCIITSEFPTVTRLSWLLDANFSWLGGLTILHAGATGPGPPLMAAGGLAGVITVWDLEKRRLATIIRDAHDGPLTKLHFFAAEPVLMSTAADNSIKHWIFDGADGAARLLRFRSGHASPPSVLRFYGDGLRILSAGQFQSLHQAALFGIPVVAEQSSPLCHC